MRDLVTSEQADRHRLAAVEQKIRQAQSHRGLFASLFKSRRVELLEPLRSEREAIRARLSVTSARKAAIKEAKTAFDSAIKNQQRVAADLRLIKQRISFARRPDRERKKAERAAAKQRKAEQDRAKLAAVDGKERKLAASVKSKIRSTDDCPYCGGDLGVQPHADHIYPIAKGGLSVSANMVLVCAECNSRKSDRTLAQFIVAYDLDRDAIERRLKMLGKDF